MNVVVSVNIEGVSPVAIQVDGDAPWEQYRALKTALNEPASFLR